MAAYQDKSHLEEIFKATLEEAKKKSKAREEEEEEGEEEEEEEGSSKKKHMKEAADKNKSIDGEEDGEEEEKEETAKVKKMKKKSMDEETLAASSLKPGAKSIADPKSKLEMMQHVLGAMHGMKKEDMSHWFHQAMAQFGPGKDYGVGNHEASNEKSIQMKPSHAEGKGGAKVNDPMPKLNVKEDVEEMFNGQDLSEEFMENATTLFEAAISARLVVEQARLEEEYAALLSEQVTTFTEEMTSKLDTYLDYVVENWMKENEVAIESTLRNELMEEFIEGLKNLFSEHYISVPQEKVDVLEALAEKVSALEEKLDETISENVELKNFVLEEQKNELVENIASDLALTQQEKFSALVEGIEFDGNLTTYEKKLKIVKENYFKAADVSYTSNIEEETFEGETTTTVSSNPVVNRYAAAIARTVKK
jgi:hypothetical protein